MVAVSDSDGWYRRAVRTDFRDAPMGVEFDRCATPMPRCDRQLDGAHVRIDRIADALEGWVRRELVPGHPESALRHGHLLTARIGSKLGLFGLESSDPVPHGGRHAFSYSLRIFMLPGADD
jgi:hypothetical protein